MELTNPRTKIEVQLPLTEKLRGRERRWVSALPQCLFKAKKFLIDDRMGEKFLVHDIRIGRDSQFAAAGPVPLAVFAGRGAEMNFPTCQVGQVFEMLVENVTHEELAFAVVISGISIE